MLKEIEQAYRSGRAMLILGAGASFNSLDAQGKRLPLGDQLASEIAECVAIPYASEPLSIVYSAAKERDSARLKDFLQKRLANTNPSRDLVDLLRYKWSRIYTLNIDDSIEVAAQTLRQRFRVFNRADSLAEADPIFDTLQIVKLNGCVNRPEQGFVFSPQEYGSGSAYLPAWYRELGQDYSSHIFIIIGSKLNEPLLQHVMAEWRKGSDRNPQRAYLISPSATEIEREHLRALNILHVAGTLQDFSDFLQQNIGQPLSGWELATARRPELKFFHQSMSSSQKRALNSVTVVNAEFLPKQKKISGQIRDFYKGYKPNWQDILDHVPAKLIAYGKFMEKLTAIPEEQNLIALLGPAGSGKTTALMVCALQLSAEVDIPIYFLREPSLDAADILQTLEEMNTSRYYIFIDRFDFVANDLAYLLQKNKVRKAILVFSERQNIWRRRLETVLMPFGPSTLKIDRIRKGDTQKILDKIRKFGPWTRLSQMTSAERREELYKRSSRQLLIGMLEATNGVGFRQIIKRDYADIGSDEHRKLLLIVGLGTIHRAAVPRNIAGRALELAGVQTDINKLVSETEGVIRFANGHIEARHPVYVRELFERIAEKDLVKSCLIALLRSFADYEPPLMRHLNKVEGFIFKSIINHRFVRRMIGSRKEEVIQIFQEFETVFYVDGLYWLQYGLALRGFGDHKDSLEKLRTARTAYTSPQIEHAYAQQLLILAEGSRTWEDAEPLVREAVDILEAQKTNFLDTDTYPIVTLAEGHVRVFRRFRSIHEARELAKQYANEMQKIKRRVVNARLEEGATNLATFAATGQWVESSREFVEQEL